MPVEADALRRPARSSSRTLAWSPSKSVRKLACVPVVPLTPRRRRVAEPMVDLLEVEQRGPGATEQARLPTVVSWAGWKWV